jgi:hypothetical protein
VRFELTRPDLGRDECHPIWARRSANAAFVAWVAASCLAGLLPLAAAQAADALRSASAGRAAAAAAQARPQGRRAGDSGGSPHDDGGWGPRLLQVRRTRAHAAVALTPPDP